MQLVRIYDVIVDILLYLQFVWKLRSHNDIEDDSKTEPITKKPKLEQPESSEPMGPFNCPPPPLINCPPPRIRSFNFPPPPPMSLNFPTPPPRAFNCPPPPPRTGSLCSGQSPSIPVDISTPPPPLPSQFVSIQCRVTSHDMDTTSSANFSSGLQLCPPNGTRLR